MQTIQNSLLNISFSKNYYSTDLLLFQYKQYQPKGTKCKCPSFHCMFFSVFVCLFIDRSINLLIYIIYLSSVIHPSIIYLSSIFLSKIENLSSLYHSISYFSISISVSIIYFSSSIISLYLSASIYIYLSQGHP